MPNDNFYREGYAEACADAMGHLVSKREEYLLAYRRAYDLGIRNLEDEANAVTADLEHVSEVSDEDLMPSYPPR